MVTLENLRKYVGDNDQPIGDDPDNDTWLQECLTEAMLLVDKYVGSAVVPEAILDKCYLMVGAELDRRREVMENPQQFMTTEGINYAPNPYRDPMAPAYSMLRKWVRPF